MLLSLYFQSVRGLTAQATGGLLTAQPLVMAALSPFAGRLSDRADPRVVACSGMGLIAVGLALLALVGPATPAAFVVACLVLLGAGFGLFSSPNTNAVMGSVEKRSYGPASGTLATMRLVGQMLSMGVVLAVFVGPAAVGPGRAAGFVAGKCAGPSRSTRCSASQVSSPRSRGDARPARPDSGGPGRVWLLSGLRCGVDTGRPPREQAEEPEPQPFRRGERGSASGLLLSTADRLAGSWPLPVVEKEA